MIVSRGCILYRLFLTPRIRWHFDLYCSHTVFIASVDNVRRIQRHPNNNIIRRAILSDEPCHQAIVAPSTTVSCVGADWGKIYGGRGGILSGHFSYKIISLHVDKNIFLLVSATLWSLSAIGLPEFGAVVFLLFSPPFPFHPFYVLFSPLFSVSLSRFPALCDVTCGFKSCMVV